MVTMKPLKSALYVDYVATRDIMTQTVHEAQFKLNKVICAGSNLVLTQVLLPHNIKFRQEIVNNLHLHFT